VVIAFTGLRDDPATRADVERRTKQGKNTKEILRCLKRHLARHAPAGLVRDGPLRSR
jgi:transposase